MYEFCTCFDRNYLLNGYTLFLSLKRVMGKEFRLHVISLDDPVHDLLARLADPQLLPLPLTRVEELDPVFAASQNNRSRVEYYFTLSPVMPLVLFQLHPEITLLHYVDSDLFFFRDVRPALAELGEKQLLICPHDFPPSLRWREKFGRFNVGFQLYRRSPETERLLRWWREQCIAWCFDRIEPDRFADQKYLDFFPERSSAVAIGSPALEAAPWNWMNRSWSPETELPVCYHFQGARYLSKHFFCTNCGSYGFPASQELRERCYLPYARALREAREELLARFPEEEIPLVTGQQRTGANVLRRFASALKHRNLMLLHEVQ